VDDRARTGDRLDHNRAVGTSTSRHSLTKLVPGIGISLNVMLDAQPSEVLAQPLAVRAKDAAAAAVPPVLSVARGLVAPVVARR
jgi:hypothetical protein